MIKEAWFLQQYASQPADAKLVMDILSLYFYPVDKYSLFNVVNTVGKISRKELDDILQQLQQGGLVRLNVSGSYILPPELNLGLFPVNITNERYTVVLQQTRQVIHAFYSISIHMQELQQLLISYFTGDRYLLSLPVRRMELQLDAYQPWLSYMLFFPVYSALLQLFSAAAFERIFTYAVKFSMLKMPPLAELEAFSRQQSYSLPEPGMLQGQLAIPDTDINEDDLFAMAVVWLYRQSPDKALTFFEKGIKRQRQQDKKHSIPLSPLFAFYYAYTLTLLPGEKGNPVITKITAAYEKKLTPSLTPALCMLHFHAGRKEKAENLLVVLLEARESNLLCFLGLLCLRLFCPQSRLVYTFQPLASTLLRLAAQHHYRLLLYEYLYLLRDEGYGGYESDYREAEKIIADPPVASMMQQMPEWERLLNTLLGADANLKKGKYIPSLRLVYLIDFDHYRIQPVLQTSLAGGGWSNGRAVALKKLKEGKAEAMVEQDLRIGATIQKTHYFNHDGASYTFDDRVWEEIAGHPYLFAADDPTVPVEIMKGAPELIVNQAGRGYTFSTNITDYSNETIFMRETPVRLKVIKLTTQQRRVLQTLSQIPVVPPDGKEKLMQVLRTIGAHITIHSDLSGSSISLQKRVGDSRIVVQLLPLGDGLKAAFFVKPFTSDPPYCKPGEGAQHIIGISNGERWQAVRDLERERNNMTTLQNLVLQLVPQELADDAIIFEDPLDALELLEIIRANVDIARAEWPEGERIKVRGEAGFQQLKLGVREKGHWFSCNGELAVDELLVLSLKELLDTERMVQKRFVALGNGEFIALEAGLRKRLQELSSIAFKDQQVLIPRFAAPVLDEWLEQAGSASTDAGWKTFIQQRVTALNLQAPVPITLQTTLRPYQEEGFRWMTHLAAWGAGACLADDMGLGKTIQAITMLLYRAKDGPALVVCPASVLPNWVGELTRFAPSLNIVYLQQGRRAGTLKTVGPFDVVLTTYGLLQSESALLSAVQWTTAVLDEAHTIKNYQTKTSKAAMSLQAAFRLMLTGTPIQNHMGEIWNLFNFLNPGLLGSLQHFNEQFVFPSVRYPDSTVKQHLKKLLAPFILRRTKTAVLDELPPKTEIMKLVTQSAEESAFYEALRRKAIENIHAYEGSGLGQQRMRAMTELSRLRMAACHPKMVDTESQIGSSKLEVFMEIVQELISNSHRALVFSQFVRHLDLVRETLDGIGINYLYLDGSTSLARRETLVKDFQGGKGDLFLISLKAGGLGLNLTAADYVIHMDPWWNPAIEEQASDRAYRIGQSRPVTIYRLIARQTIEEKIIDLHHNKRDLADRLLEGTDQSAKLSAQELMELINSY
ncbi:MAG TPA: DEAD/DEAH box helicase [Chitinophaga sp.]|uniref:DEAD/DEAH box helicase n=1 Tax=Chitinophaga sp. TaxID=1869181 RepID=UPI002C393208|nr:DEAD/DEAH box helicase [Chitinophaga sp.]HVI47243.1 DEAD/DEAH box helicase [Chitinophaga sp.]